MSVLRPSPMGKQIKLDSKRYIVSKTDTKGDNKKDVCLIHRSYI